MTIKAICNQCHSVIRYIELSPVREQVYYTEDKVNEFVTDCQEQGKYGYLRLYCAVCDDNVDFNTMNGIETQLYKTVKMIDGISK